MKIPNTQSIRAVALAAIAFTLSGGFTLQAEEPEATAKVAVREKPLLVVTSFLPLQSHTLALAGDGVVVEQLLSRDTGPHDFQLSPRDVQRLSQADLFIINGGGLEEWLDNLVSKTGNKSLRVIDTSAGIETSGSPEAMTIEGVEAVGHHHHHHGHSHGPGESCGADGVNPHFWLDPILALEQAGVILKALQEADPAQADVFAKNAEAYFAKIKALDAEFRETLTPLPNKNLVTFHDAFPYLAARYGLNYVGFIEQFPEKDPTPQQLAALVKAIKENQVGVLFAEKGYSTSLLKRVAEQSGAKVSELDTLEVGQGAADSYLERMRANLEALRQSLAGTPSS